MSSSNTRARRPVTNFRAVAPVTNHYGTVVNPISAEEQLTRLVLANMLWEDQFYIDGKETAGLIGELVKQVSPDFASKLAVAARTTFKLRHVPLLLTRELAKIGALRAPVLAEVISRPDELGEFISLYWKDGKKPLANQVKRGLALAFNKFNEFQFAKWDKNSAAVKLRDVMFLVHPKPADVAQELLFKKIANQELATPDTWETELSAGKDKYETFTRLMRENKLGALAFLRNLRNMRDAGVSLGDMVAYSERVNVSMVLPFRYIAAYRVVPELKSMLEAMLFRSLASQEKLKGKTKLYVDVSSSMYAPKVSAKSDLTRQDASLALAMLCREICEEVEIYSFSGRAIKIQNLRGFALADAIKNSQGCSGTDLGRSLNDTGSPADRIIVFTDEQSTSIGKPMFGATGYIVNVAAYQNGVNHGDWLTITGFSEAVLSYIQAVENSTQLF